MKQSHRDFQKMMAYNLALKFAGSQQHPQNLNESTELSPATRHTKNKYVDQTGPRPPNCGRQPNPSFLLARENATKSQLNQ